MEWNKVKEIGRGSFSCVLLGYKADDPSCTSVAIKSCKLKDSSILVKEKRILQKLQGCPHVIGFIADSVSLHPEAGTIYELVLEYAAGGSLIDYTNSRGGCLPDYEVRSFTRMILSGLCAIHSKGYVHCDIKPDNILVFPQEGGMYVKIADFGLAKTPGEEDEYKDSYVRKFRATPYYMSPDSVETGVIDCSLDIWSLGCVAVEMISGFRAMGSSQDGELPEPEAIIARKPYIPANISNLCKDFLEKCFLRNPAERWTDVMLLDHPYLQSSETDATGI